MSQKASIELRILGRMVQGDLYDPNDTDMEGNPLTVKTGKNKGQERVEYFMAIAVAKTPGVTHWASEPWGAPIWAFGHAQWPNGQAQNESFAWKIEDGDSPKPNKRGRKNCETEGMPGHWIVKCKSSFAPKVFTDKGEPITEKGAVKCGYYVDVFGNIQSNENSTNPGIYLNHSMVAYVGWAKEIVSGPDARQLFKGGYQLPAGASAVPPSGAGGVANLPPPPAPAAAPGVPPPPAPAPSYAAPPPPAPAPAPAPTAVAPSAAFVAPPPPSAAPPPPPAAAGPVMTAKANGMSYAQFIAANWTDAQLRAQGYMQ